MWYVDGTTLWDDNGYFHAGVENLRVRVTQCPRSTQTNRMSLNKKYDLD